MLLVRAALSRSRGLPAPPLREELGRLELREVGAQRARRAGRSAPARCPRTARSRPWRSRAPRRGRSAPGPRSSAGPRPALRTHQLVLAVGLHARTAAARSSSRSPWKTRPSIDDRRDVEHAGGGRRRAVASLQPLGDRAEPGALDQRGRVHLARGGGDQHVVALAEVAPARERLPERGQRERHAAADLLRVGRGQQRPLRVGRERVGPADRPAARSGARAPRRPRGRSCSSSAQRNAPTPPAASPPSRTGIHSGTSGSTCITRSAARYASGEAKS